VYRFKQEHTAPLSIGALEDTLLVQYAPNIIDVMYLNSDEMTLDFGEMRQTFFLSDTDSMGTPLPIQVQEQSFIVQMFEHGGWRTLQFAIADGFVEQIELSLPQRRFRRIEEHQGLFLLVGDRSFSIN